MAKWQGKTKVLGEKELLNYHLTCMDYPGIELRLP
jgi:hypothetical protein